MENNIRKVGRPKKINLLDVDTEVEKRPVGRPKKVKVEKIKQAIGKPKGTKNDYNKQYCWIVTKDGLDQEFANIKDISKSLNLPVTSVNKMIYQPRIKKPNEITIKKQMLNLKVLQHNDVPEVCEEHNL